MAGDLAGSGLHVAHAHNAAGMSMTIPVHVTNVRAEIPISSSDPQIHAPRAIVSIQSPRSAENTRPRKRSSVLSCNRVVENTQTVAPPQCATAAHRQASHTFPDLPISA